MARFFAKEPGSVVEVFEAMLELAESNAQRPGRTRMFNVLAAEAGEPGHPAHDFFVRRYGAVIAKIAGALRGDLERGVLEPGTDCEGVASELVAVMDGLQLQWALAPGAYDMTGGLRRYIDRLLRSINRDGSGLPK